MLEVIVFVANVFATILNVSVAALAVWAVLDTVMNWVRSR